MQRKWVLSGIPPGDWERVRIATYPDARWQQAIKTKAFMVRRGWTHLRLRAVDVEEVTEATDDEGADKA